MLIYIFSEFDNEEILCVHIDQKSHWIVKLEFMIIIYWFLCITKTQGLYFFLIAWQA